MKLVLVLIIAALWLTGCSTYFDPRGDGWWGGVGEAKYIRKVAQLLFTVFRAN
jgi:hypothetical protein